MCEEDRREEIEIVRMKMKNLQHIVFRMIESEELLKHLSKVRRILSYDFRKSVEGFSCTFQFVAMEANMSEYSMEYEIKCDRRLNEVDETVKRRHKMFSISNDMDILTKEIKLCKDKLRTWTREYEKRKDEVELKSENKRSPQLKKLKHYVLHENEVNMLTHKIEHRLKSLPSVKVDNIV